MYEIKYALPSVNLSYANLITVLVKESRREEGNSHPPSQRFRIFFISFFEIQLFGKPVN